MNDIRNALRKAGLVGSKDEKRFQHEERVRRKELGRDGLAEEARQQDEERRRRAEEDRAKVREAQKEHDRRRKEHERLQELLQLLEGKALRRGVRGPRRFHYREADGHLPYLAIHEAIGRRLEAGELALVRHPEPPHERLIVPREVAQALSGLAPERVLYLAGH